jgi:hypothetical protein
MLYRTPAQQNEAVCAHLRTKRHFFYTPVFGKPRSSNANFSCPFGLSLELQMGRWRIDLNRPRNQVVAAKSSVALPKSLDTNFNLVSAPMLLCFGAI